MKAESLIIAGSLLPGCLLGAGVAQEDLDALIVRVEVLESENAALTSELALLSDEEGASHLTAAALDGLASEAWVEKQGYHLAEDAAAIADLLAYLTADTATDTITFQGANVYIQSGSGASDDDGALLGRGNLFIGYNIDVDVEDSAEVQTGSHNLIIGDEHTFTSHGGFLAGYNNAIHAPHGSAPGGTFNVINGAEGVAVGGRENTIDGDKSVIVGGRNNATDGYADVILGGRFNETEADYCAVVGGTLNTATSEGSVILGGQSLTTSESYSITPDCTCE